MQDGKTLNLFAGDGIAVRETVMAPGHGRADYLLYVEKRVVGVIEAKPVGTTLSGVEWQSAMYSTGLPISHRKRAVLYDDRLPFVFEAPAPKRTSPTASTPIRGHARFSIFLSHPHLRESSARPTQLRSDRRGAQRCARYLPWMRIHCVRRKSQQSAVPNVHWPSNDSIVR